MLAFALLTEPGPVLRAEVTLAEARPAPHREVEPTVRIHPPAGADGADWMSVLAWKGGGSRLEHLRETAPGVWTTTAPLPVHGEWKTMVRLHSGRSIRALPIYMPEDRAIPAAGVSAEPRSTRAFVSDKQVLQREAVGSSALQLPAYLILVAIAAAWLGTITWGLARLAAGGGGTEASAERPSRVRSGGPRLRQPRPPAPAP